VPGASAPLLSSAIHSAVPAQVAGVQDIALVAPPRHNNDVHPAILAVAAELGIFEVYRMGGARPSRSGDGHRLCARVDKIVGPACLRATGQADAVRRGGYRHVCGPARC
jgi:histidinol dehydrogenase